MNTGRSRRPTAKYTKVGERLRHVIPSHMQCSMACGGRACKYENPARWSEQEQAIKGLYSSWITDNILAMSRPSTDLIGKYNIIEQFQRCDIKTVINLQRPGEHASCGNPLEQESGFTYLPEAFMEAGIYFYNFGWKDYGVASLTTILDMVKVMTFALQEGRVAIHCHAGLGRTAQGKFNPGKNEDDSSACHRARRTKRILRSKTFSSGLAYHGKEKKEEEEEEEEEDEELKALNYSFVKKDIYGRKISSEDSDSSKAENEIYDIRELSETIPHIIVQSELTQEARRILAAKALAGLNEFMEAEEMKSKVEMWQKELNNQNGAWDKICTERDPFILSNLMWSWIEQLKEPLLTKADVDVLAKNNTDFQEAFKLLEKGKYHTILCILNCVVNLQTIPTDVEGLLLNRAIKAFTKMNYDSEGGSDVYSILKNVFKQILEHQRQYTSEETEQLL
ncbi:protein tyrosine phosphatase domain-containing protein 1 [Crotalus adamanteus]|uniref:Protein tyrosine phosphatase domain-containing protein 1 n=1 Tax=Crotalus adamanteus TaxID=8729 RepID=A0AAW1BVQ9_CROAD